MIFEGLLAAHRGTADAAGVDWKSAVFAKAEEEVKAGCGLTVTRMLELGWVSRSGFYRFDAGAKPEPVAGMDLRDAIQRIAVEMPSYGRRRVTAELRRRGWVVNPKKVHRLMREDNLLCVRRVYNGLCKRGSPTIIKEKRWTSNLRYSTSC